MRVWKGSGWLTIFTVYAIRPDSRVVWFDDGSQIVLPVEFPLTVDEPEHVPTLVQTADRRTWAPDRFRLVGSRVRPGDNVMGIPARNGEYPVFLRLADRRLITHDRYLLIGGVK